MRRQTKLAAFTLVEVCVALMIFAVLAGLIGWSVKALTLKQSKKSAASYAQTQQIEAFLTNPKYNFTVNKCVKNTVVLTAKTNSERYWLGFDHKRLVLKKYNVKTDKPSGYVIVAQAVTNGKITYRNYKLTLKFFHSEKNQTIHVVLPSVKEK